MPGELRDPNARWRMMRSVNSGRCLFSNRDGRFGAYNCTPRFTDQYWHGYGEGYAPPPSPPPQPTARDCGTGPGDAGCYESRNGQWAMDRDTWAGLQANVSSTPNELSKRDMIAGMLQNAYVTAQQFMWLLDQFSNELTRMELARTVASHVVDPRRALVYGPRFRNSFTREEFVRLMSQQ
jgi:hypothetical protein